MNTDDVCEINIAAEGWQGGWIVRVIRYVHDEDSMPRYLNDVFHLSKNQLENVLSSLVKISLEKGNNDEVWRDRVA